MIPRASIIVPVYNEGENARKHLLRLVDETEESLEIVVVYDFPSDSTVSVVDELAQQITRIRGVLNELGPGPANAIRAGIQSSVADVVVVTMADGCDDPSQIGELVRLVERGVMVACASRYMRGGRQIGGPGPKRILSKVAGLSLYWLARVGTHDATNSFKAYSRDFVSKVSIESDSGFEIGIEMIAKARRLRVPVAEVSTIWLDRSMGVSHFKIGQWISAYLRWYLHAFGAKRTFDQYATPEEVTR